MPLHLIKVCVGIESIKHLAKVQKSRREGGPKAVFHYTRHTPKRAEEILAGGSMYWIVKGNIAVRQRILGFTLKSFEDEGEYCGIKLDRKLVPLMPHPRRPHQGWRYFEDKDVPADLKGGARAQAALPVALLTELKSLGLI